MTIIKNLEPSLITQFQDLKNRIIKAQYKALYKANAEMLEAYFDIGRVISQNLESKKWGSSVVDELVEYFRIELSGVSGLNKRNLYYMKTFYKRYKDYEFLHEATAQITWTHHREILDGTKTLEEAIFYSKLAVTKQYSSVVLKSAIKSKEFENYKINQHNLVRTLENYEANTLIVGDNTNLDFLLLSNQHKEKELEDGIVNNIVKFLGRMGGKMAFVGRQIPVKFSENQYFIDLLFYHLDLNCYIVFELKVDSFKPDYIGQLALYLGAVNKEIKKVSDKPTIGILLCRDKDRIAVEYILDTINAPVGVTTYTYSELPIEIAKYLPRIDNIDFRDNAKNK